MIRDHGAFIDRARTVLQGAKARNTNMRSWILQVIAEAKKPIGPVALTDEVTRRFGSAGHNTAGRALYDLRKYKVLEKTSDGFVPLPTPGDPRVIVVTRRDGEEEDVTLLGVSAELEALIRRDGNCEGDEIASIVIEVFIGDREA